MLSVTEGWKGLHGARRGQRGGSPAPLASSQQPWRLQQGLQRERAGLVQTGLEEARSQGRAGEAGRGCGRLPGLWGEAPRPPGSLPLPHGPLITQVGPRRTVLRPAKAVPTPS